MYLPLSQKLYQWHKAGEGCLAKNCNKWANLVLHKVTKTLLHFPLQNFGRVQLEGKLSYICPEVLRRRPSPKTETNISKNWTPAAIANIHHAGHWATAVPVVCNKQANSRVNRRLLTWFKDAVDVGVPGTSLFAASSFTKLDGEGVGLICNSISYRSSRTMNTHDAPTVEC